LSTIGFIADLHLSEEQPERMALFLRFLEKYTHRLNKLYILGDLFEVWLGDDIIHTAYQPMMSALKKASNTLPIEIIHGNRDFLLGDQFALLSGCKMVDEPLVIKLATETTLLMHGDLLCTDDHDYQQMRKKLRSTEWRQSFLNQPLQKRRELALDLRQQSKTATREKDCEITDTNEQEIVHYLDRFQATILIHGHTHRTAIHDHTLTAGLRATRYVLDEWSNGHGQILIADDDKLRFETIE